MTKFKIIKINKKIDLKSDSDWNNHEVDLSVDLSVILNKIKEKYIDEAIDDTIGEIGVWWKLKQIVKIEDESKLMGFCDRDEYWMKMEISCLFERG